MRRGGLRLLKACKKYFTCCIYPVINDFNRNIVVFKYLQMISEPCHYHLDSCQDGPRLTSENVKEKRLS